MPPPLSRQEHVLGAEAEEERVTREHAERGRLRANAPLAKNVKSSSRNVQPKFDVELERTAAEAAAKTDDSKLRRVEHTNWTLFKSCSHFKGKSTQSGVKHCLFCQIAAEKDWAVGSLSTDTIGN